MQAFDDLLRQGLMEANLIEYTSELDNLPGPDFSPKYRRGRKRLLANPRTWMRRRTQPVWKRAARTAACVLLACTVAFGALMAASPTVRAAVSTWLLQITLHNGYMDMVYTPSVPDEAPVHPPWRITWLPEGWELSNLISYSDWEFFNGAANHWNNTFVNFSHRTDRYDVSYNFPDDAFDTHEKTTIHGRPADYFEGDRQKALFWEAEDGSLLSLTSYFNIERDVLEQIAASAAPWTEASAEYEMGWVPEGHRENALFNSPGAGSSEWIADHIPLLFQYVADPICPFSLPSRTPEEVSVNGLPGLFWPTRIPVEDKADGIDFESEDWGVVWYDLEDQAVLTWEDPETNTIFRINGILEEEDLLRMAESVARKSS